MLQVVLLFYSGLALLYPPTMTLLSLLALSVARGLASSFLWLTSWAYVFTYTDKPVRGKETGLFSDMNDLASSISPIVGGILSIVSFFFPFYVLSITSFLAFLVVSFRLRAVPRPRKASLEHQMSTLSRHMRDTRFVKTVFMIVVFYALINIYYSFLSVFLNDEGISIPLIGVTMTVALVPAVALEVPTGHLLDKYGVRKILSAAVLLTTVTATMIPLSDNIYYATFVVTAFTVCYTLIFIALYSRMSDVMCKDKIAMTGAIATFKDLGYTLGPLLAGALISFIGIESTFIMTGAAFILLLPVTLTLHD